MRHCDDWVSAVVSDLRLDDFVGRKFLMTLCGTFRRLDDTLVCLTTDGKFVYRADTLTPVCQLRNFPTLTALSPRVQSATVLRLTRSDMVYSRGPNV